jgi:hypothetical protein
VQFLENEEDLWGDHMVTLCDMLQQLRDNAVVKQFAASKDTAQGMTCCGLLCSRAVMPTIVYALYVCVPTFVKVAALTKSYVRNCL